jgi:hypothetical protein
MKKYRKKPIVVEAHQYDGTKITWKAILDWMQNGTYVEPEVPEGTPNVTMFSIPTLEGPMFVKAGDYVIKGVQGEFYPCKPDIFEETYEVVESWEPDFHEVPD